MTDEEIEKALELCKSEDLPCQECAYWHIATQGYNCRNALIRDVADYINRLKAEQEDMHGKIMNLRTYIDNHEEIWKRNAEIDKAIVRKDTAKEMLQAIAECRTLRSDVRGKRYNRYELDQKDFENIANRFGVEVDE